MKDGREKGFSDWKMVPEYIEMEGVFLFQLPKLMIDSRQSSTPSCILHQMERRSFRLLQRTSYWSKLMIRMSLNVRFAEMFWQGTLQAFISSTCDVLRHSKTFARRRRFCNEINTEREHPPAGSGGGVMNVVNLFYSLELRDRETLCGEDNTLELRRAAIYLKNARRRLSHRILCGILKSQ